MVFKPVGLRVIISAFFTFFKIKNVTCCRVLYVFLNNTHDNIWWQTVAGNLLEIQQDIWSDISANSYLATLSCREPCEDQNSERDDIFGKCRGSF